MKVVIAIDSFKGSLSTYEAGDAVAKAIKTVLPDACVTVSPLADGGEGTAEAIISSRGGTMRKIKVTGPLGESIDAAYGIIPKTKTAIIEMASAAGITLVPKEMRDPLHTTTYGVGEMIADAVRQGCRDFIVGIGGSATNDGGVGMRSALGFDFLDKDGAPIPMGARGLKDLAKIETKNALSELSECSFSVACDVKNPLCGDNGCSAVYGPQKGATADMDAWLASYAELTKAIFPHSDANFPGAGAAGGLGFAFLAYLGGILRSGVELVIEATALEEKIKDADIVITGEGRLDGQSAMGKAPIGVARKAKKYGKLVIAFSGCVTEDATLCNEHGIDAFFPILRAPSSLEEAMNVETAYKNLYSTAEQVMRLIKAN